LELLTLRQASKWASSFLNKIVTESNISYLINYGRIPKKGGNGQVFVSKEDLQKYYDSFNGSREIHWKSKLGEDLNWRLSFDEYKEFETTKHVHRLHPYKGKFIPQLVEYFLDNHTDEFKKKIYFKKGDIILDPFCGSGTTLVQASELGIHAVGIEISEFNTLISNAKLGKYDLDNLKKEIKRISNVLNKYLLDSQVVEFDEKLASGLVKLNNTFFPPGEYAFKINRGLIDEIQHSETYLKRAKKLYDTLLKEYKINIKRNEHLNFLDKWYIEPVREEIQIVFEELKKINNINTKKILTIVLSRTIRSCRATTHSDLATLKEPVTSLYYCTKHNKICKPIFSIKKMWDRYTKDTLKRLSEFKESRTQTDQICITGDSRFIDLPTLVEKKNNNLASKIKNDKFAGIFSSPPYVGLIDYHEQHAYAYDLFGFKRRDELEIGPLSKGQGKQARESYVESISRVLNNCKNYFKNDYNVFLVANDKYNLYPAISERSGMKIINQFKRPVLNRTEKDKGAYSEIIFHLKDNA